MIVKIPSVAVKNKVLRAPIDVGVTTASFSITWVQLVLLYVP